MASKSSSVPSGSAGYGDIPGTNIPRQADVANSDSLGSAPAQAPSSSVLYQEIPGTNVPRRVQVADVYQPGAFAGNTTAVTTDGSSGYADIPGTNIPRKTQLTATGENTSDKVGQEIKNAVAQALGRTGGRHEKDAVGQEEISRLSG